jgi:carboxyl-terminal processing protease
MSSTTKSILSATGVIVSVAAVVVGFRARQQADVGGVQTADSGVSIDRMVASRTNDINVPAGDYFYELTQKLRDQYVEPVTDENKLVTGAIRGMIASLQDPQSQYMDSKQFKAFANAREGKFEGIGADFDLVVGSKAVQAEASGETTPSEATPEEALATVNDIPRLQVVSVVPGGPADRAKVKIGDVVYSVDGHWVVNSELIKRFKQAREKFLAKKMPLSELNVLRQEIRAKVDKAILPLRAKDQLFMGRSGTVSVVWDRGATQRTTKITKAESTLPGFSVHGSTIYLPLIPSSASSLKKAIVGKSSITIDLRNNTLGDFGSMKQCLEVLVPKGQYGNFTTLRHDKPTPLSVYKGNPNPPAITLITDKSTRGAAEIFALALSSRGFAQLTGTATGGDRDNRAIFRMPDGSGYTIVTSIYKPTIGRPTAVAVGGAK